MAIKALLFLALFMLSHLPCESARLARNLALVPSPSTILTYHGGLLLTRPAGLHLYFLWYGDFTAAQKAVLSDFASSFSSKQSPSPSVASWWSATSAYKDSSNAAVSSSVSLASQASVPAPSSPSSLTKADLLSILLSSFSSKSVPIDPHGVYFILTSSNIPVEDFCMNSCGFHDSTPASPATNNLKLPFAWIGNPSQQCPGLCAWPFALPTFGPQTTPLIPPNQDVGMDGMVINMATLLAGIATNPDDTGYYQGDAAAPLEAVSACTGIFGTGAYPGNPGNLFVDQKTKASYNAHGADGRSFLLPAMWNPKTLTCAPLS